MDHMVSVLIPHYNRAELLAETLKSLGNQSHSNWEAIVVDDGSTDEVVDQLQQIARNDARVRILRRTAAPKGPSMCRNQALENARGEFIILLDSDDLLAPWCLENRIRMMNSVIDKDFVVFPAMVFRSNPGDQNAAWNILDSVHGDLDRFLSGTPPWCVSSPLWKVEALRRIGGLKEKLRYGEDAELHTRAILAGLSYRKFADAMPDVFIRRDETQRFSNVITNDLLAAKRNYIEEGLRLLQSRQENPQKIAKWEKRYFEELEFLIYNVQDNRLPIQQLLAQWVKNYHPSTSIRWLFIAYGAVGRLTRQHAYLVLRLARRIVLGIMPQRFRSAEDDCGFENAALPPKQYEALKRRLGEATSPSEDDPGDRNDSWPDSPRTLAEDVR